LREMGYTPLEITGEKKGVSSLGKIKIGGNKIKLKDLSIFCRQFATMVNSGLPILRALAILADQTESEPLAVVVTQVRLDVELGGKLPLPTQVLLTMSEIFKKWWYVVLAAAFGARYALRRYKATEKGREVLDGLKLKAPVFGSLFHKTALSRFSSTLGMLLRSGVPILQALDIVADTVNNKVISRAVGDVQGAVREGESMAKPLSKHGVFPPMVVQLLAVGEETGA